MIEHSTQFAASGIPFIFDPGQGLPMFGGEELDQVAPALDTETLEQCDPASVHHRLNRPEHAADVNQGDVDDHDSCLETKRGLLSPGLVVRSTVEGGAQNFTTRIDLVNVFVSEEFGEPLP